jgi:hypothetical protein
MADERKLGSSAPMNMCPYFCLVMFLSYVRWLPDEHKLCSSVNIFINFWPTNISLFPIVK